MHFLHLPYKLQSLFNQPFSPMQLFIKPPLLAIFIALLSLCSCNEDSNIIENLDDTISINSQSRASNEGIVLEFPDKETIARSPIVQAAMDQAWQRMKLLVEPYYYRQEVGFYIYYNHQTKTFWIGNLEEGPLVYYDTLEPATICLGRAKNNYEVCAFFHCHTPWYGIDKDHLYRPTGPSEKDIDFANYNDLPGFVYDYFDPYIAYWFPYEEMFPKLDHFGPDKKTTLHLQNNPYL